MFELNTGTSSNSGHIRVFEYDGSNWTQMGSNIYHPGYAPQGRHPFYFGSTLNIDSSGNRIAIGSHQQEYTSTILQMEWLECMNGMAQIG